MLQEFKRLPEPLQRQILIRLGLALLSLVLFIPILLIMRDIYLCIPCAGVMIFYATSAFFLFRRAILGEYVVVSGECVEIVLTAVKRRAKYIMITTDVCNLKVVLHSRLRKIPNGAAIKLYIAKNAQIFEQNGAQVLYNYIAMDVK